MAQTTTTPAARQPDRGVTPAMVAGLAGRCVSDLRSWVDTVRLLAGPDAADALRDVAAAVEYADPCAGDVVAADVLADMDRELQSMRGSGLRPVHETCEEAGF